MTNRVKLKRIHKGSSTKEEICICPGAPCNCSLAVELEKKYSKLRDKVGGMAKQFAIKSAKIKELKKTIAELQKRATGIANKLGGADRHLTKELQFLKHSLTRTDNALSILRGDSVKRKKVK